MKRLNKKVIVVTGGSGLLGKSIIEKILTEGGIAINLDINHSTDISNGTICCDITNLKSVISSVELLITHFGRIDGWVNNAYPRTPDWTDRFEDVSLDAWRKNLDMQLGSIFASSQIVLKQMKIQNSGSIVNIASIYGVVAPDFDVYQGTNLTMPAAYSAIKGGLLNFSRYLASYYGSSNVRVNCVSPGGIFNYQEDAFVKNYTQRVPLKRMGLPEDIAPAVVFLLSSESSYITGQNIVVDGGWTCI